MGSAELVTAIALAVATAAKRTTETMARGRELDPDYRIVNHYEVARGRRESS